MPRYELGFSTETSCISACCREYLAVAKGLILHIQMENDMLFAGLARSVLRSKTSTRRKAWLFASHQFAAERLMKLLRDGTQDAPEQALVRSVKLQIEAVQRLMKINQALLSDEITRKEQRVDAIMRRIRTIELPAAMPGPKPVALITREERHVAH